MHVVATAGHVDHGKSTLVRALTGMEPDRWAEERRRGMTIDLGFAWTRLPEAGDDTEVAFVDVPGHERFVPNMLAGVGPVPTVMLVVAADEGWRQQSTEHLLALRALGVEHGLLVVTRADLADPGPARAEALDRLAGTPLAGSPAVAVSAVTGAGMAELRKVLAGVLSGLPQPPRDGRVRLWVDRSFTIRGAGTVVTGTLPSGCLRVGDELELAGTGRRMPVRGLQSLGRDAGEVVAVARVALNLRGIDRDEVRRGDALVTPDGWVTTRLVDVRLSEPPAADHPLLRRADSRVLVLHVGSAAVPVRMRRLGAGSARLTLTTGLPLSVGDRALLRDPSRHDTVLGVTVLDPLPAPLARRGAAVARAAELGTVPERPDGRAELRRRGLVRVQTLRALGAEPPWPPVAGEWVADPDWWRSKQSELAELVAHEHEAHPLEHGVPVENVRQRLRLPDARLVAALTPAPLVLAAGRVADPRHRPGLPDAVRAGVDVLRAELTERPFTAPEAGRLRDLRLGQRELAAAERAGLLLRVGDGLVLLPDAPERAVAALRALPQPFTVSEARQALATTRRVAVPLLELLDRLGLTDRADDGSRRVRR
ncbi:MAG TPA: selenocysteine-specific translation elongation factor [Actinomycetes bacterium]